MSLEAAAPGRNATVFASAGSGKTWLLVTRMLRLLLAGARPGGILAITFTRKAAGEMRARLLARLRDWACAEPETLAHMLEAIGVEPDAAAVRRARGLYETILFDPQPMRMTTFHAFCQDVLRRFPLEAAVPPGFELLEATGELRARAWDALFAEATREPDAETAAALQALFDGCRGLDNTRRALDGFLEHRGDWWAYTEDRPDPVGHASARLAEYLQVDAESQPEAELIAAEASALQRFGELLRRHPTATNLTAAERLDAALAPQTASEEAFRLAWAVFFTGAGQPRKRKASATQARRMGAEGEQEFLGLHQRLVRALQKARSVIAAMQTLATNQAWLRAGARYLSHYERLKAELRLLDFTDLEWRSYRLLNHADNALWVQYKLDARIDHLLIDEFQDTNPTQWRLILPLLEELAAGESERGRSVFLVGDPKQSIYAFRRAKPELQDTAADWLDQHLGARRQGLDKSWRSAPVIMQLVNEVFTSTALADRIVGFPHHDTHRQELWGRVELLPLAIPPESEPESAPSALRDPLAEPRTYDPNSAQLAEGRLIAERIASLIRSRTPIQAGDGIRPVGYDDIVILMRGRTHAAAIERALREAKIPYSGIERGTLLDALEVQDLVALLQLLTAPHDDLALAQVLRSPIFDATDDDLIRLARTSGRSWMERLERVAIEEPTEAPLARAWRMLADWRSRAGSLPIHDLLDRVFHQADVIARYAAAVREDLAASVTANLQQFLELALEVDSGRYPSIVHFLGRLQGLQARGDEAPDSPPAAGAVPRVRLMTIHAAKGLESPVVFLADTATRPAGNRAYQTLVDWPARDERPRLMLMIGRGEDREDRQQSLLDADTGIERREQANLLYVALTRARQYLFLSGSGGSESTEEGWYEPLREAMARLGEPSAAGGHACECGSAPPIPVPTSSRPEEALSPLEAGLSTPLQPPSSEHEIAPSHLVHAGGGISDDVDARLRGVAVHRLLDRLSRTPGQPAPDIVETLAAELGLAPRAPELRAWLDEAQGLIGDPALEHLFEPSRFAEAWNEVPLIYTVDDRRVHGVIDRLIRFESRLLVLDYKTHRIEGPEQARALAERYAPQLGHYVAGVARLWPGLPVEAALLLTSTRRLVPVALERTAAAPHISKI